MFYIYTYTGLRLALPPVSKSASSRRHLVLTDNSVLPHWLQQQRKSKERGWLTPLLWAVAEKEWSRLGWGEPFSARPPSVLLRVPQTPRCPPWARGADCDTLSLQSPPAPMFSELWALPPLPLRRAAHQEKEGQQLAAQSWCRASDTHSKSAEGAQQPLNCCRRHCLVCGVGAILGVT